MIFKKNNEKIYLNALKNQTMAELYNFEFSYSIANTLVIPFSEERLSLLKEKQVELEAKDTGLDPKKIYDAKQQLEKDIKKEEEILAITKQRIENYKEEIRVRRGKLEFIEKYSKGMYHLI